jgi:hypothetical protein
LVEFLPNFTLGILIGSGGLCDQKSEEGYSMTGWTNGQQLTQTLRSRAILLVVMAAGGLGPFVQAQAPPAAAPAATPAPESVSLETSDRVNINIVYYPAVVQPAAPVTPPPAVPVVMLLHDLNGSNESLVGLAKSLQKRGFAVVVPDLRGHGDSTTRTSIDGLLKADDLTKADFEAMVVARGGQIRAQAINRGDVEVVRGWIKEQASSGVLDMKRVGLWRMPPGATAPAVLRGERSGDSSWSAQRRPCVDFPWHQHFLHKRILLPITSSDRFRSLSSQVRVSRMPRDSSSN